MSEWERIRANATAATGAYAVFCGDARAVLGTIPDESVHTCLTSPPYWGARDYGHDRQMGLEADPDEYVAGMVAVFREVRRILRPEGTAWVNVGDSYFHSRPAGWKQNKQLCLIPFRLAIAMQEDGWLLRNAAVWHKSNGSPSSVRDRLTNTWEPTFLFSRSAQYYFNLDAIRVPHRTDGEAERRRAAAKGGLGKASGKAELRKWAGSPRHRATIDGRREVRRRPGTPDCVELAAYLRDAMEKKGVDVRWVAGQLGVPYERTRHYFRADRIGCRLPPEEVWERLKTLLDLDTTYDEAMAVEVGDNVIRNHPNGRNPGDVQSFAVSGSANDHFAMMPEALAEWTLKASLPPGGICLDPFMGVGTTGIAAVRQGGRFIGVDLSQDFLNQFIARHDGKGEDNHEV